MIIKLDNGNKRYYYYKKKRGRPKKRGPKPKKRPLMKRGPKPKKSILGEVGEGIFQVIHCINRKRKKKIGDYTIIDDLTQLKNKILEQNKTIVFPQKYGCFNKTDKFVEVKNEYIVLKQVTDERDSRETYLENDYGKMTKHITDDNEWVVYDKYTYLVEETFWVFGYDSKKERKTFSWILQNLIINKYPQSRYDYIRIQIYHNKFIIKYDDGTLGLVLCKNVSDSIRMYNMCEEYCKKNKYKRILFTGYIRNGERKQNMLKELMETTGWNYKKLSRKELRVQK